MRGQGVKGEVVCERRVVARPAFVVLCIMLVAALASAPGCGGKKQLAPTVTNAATGKEMILIPAGEFTMGTLRGDGDERPPQKVHLDAYYMMKTEVTNAEYAKFLKAVETDGAEVYAHKHAPRDHEYRQRFFQNDLVNQPDHPVVGVDLYCASAFAKWAGLMIPTEAQWEKAARGDADERVYPWGSQRPELPDGRYLANFNESDRLGGDDLDGYLYTSPVGAFPDGASPYGVLDMAGNVWEWTRSYYDPKFYERMSAKNPVGPPVRPLGVIRGGSWRFSLWEIRCTNRTKAQTTDRKKDTGFRCVLEP